MYQIPSQIKDSESLNQICQKRVFSIQKRMNEHHRQVLLTQINLGVKFHRQHKYFQNILRINIFTVK